MMVIPDPAVASILGFSGVDFVIIDAEHGPFTLTSMRLCIEALKATPAGIVVRTASAERVEIQSYLDLGADGVLVPHVENGEEVESIVRAVRYPPDGRRGLGPVRANRYGLDFAEYLGAANSSIALMVIIESGRGVDNAAEIAAVQGLDGIMIGPTDLAADLGVSGESDYVRVQQAIDRVIRCSLDAGLKIGAHTEAPSAEEHDAMLVLCFTDATGLAGAAESAVEQARNRAELDGGEPRDALRTNREPYRS